MKLSGRGRLSAWYRRRWFVAVLATIALLWFVTTVAYGFGAGGITFGSRVTGNRARIDFQRAHDRPVLDLAAGVGLQLDGVGGGLRGTVVTLRPGLPLVFCWLCGRDRTAGAIADVEHRAGDWLYRAPADLARQLADMERAGGSPRWRTQRRAMISTLAYNRATGERLEVAATATADDQARELAARGLVTSELTRLSVVTLADLRAAPMQREGCVVVQAAFIAAALLWLVLGGLALGLVTLTRRARRRRPGTGGGRG